MSVADVPGGVVLAGQAPEPDRRRWFVLAVVGLAQLMIVLDITIMNIALPSAQQALHFSNADRQWVITAYALAFGSLLLFGGRLGDLFGRKVTFLTGLAGFAIASAVGGASRRAPARARSARCWRRPRCPCSPPRSANRKSGAGRSVCTGRSPAAAGWSGCCSAAC
jgi:hypothetical protein